MFSIACCMSSEYEVARSFNTTMSTSNVRAFQKWWPRTICCTSGRSSFESIVTSRIGRSPEMP